MACKEVISDNKHVSVLFPASTAYEKGDLLWYDAAANAPKKASARTDTGSKAGNQADFAPLFLGVCSVQRLAAQTTAGRGIVVTHAVCDVNCPSRVWKYGELVGVDRDATPLNHNQQVDVVTLPHLAIGLCVQDTGGVASTLVRCLLVSKVAWAPGEMQPGFFAAQAVGTAAALADADTTLTNASALIQAGVPTAARKVILPAPAAAKGLAFLVVNNSAGAFALNVRDAGDTVTIQAVAQNKRAIFFCDGTTWYGILGA